MQHNSWTAVEFFLLPFGKPHMGNPPQILPYWDVTDCSSVPSGHTLSIDTVISWILALEPSFCAWQMGAWLPLVPGSLNDGLSVLLGNLSLITRSSSEYCCPWIDSDSDPLTLLTIFSLCLLKCVNWLSAVNHSKSNYGSSLGLTWPESLGYLMCPDLWLWDCHSYLHCC